MNQNLCICFHHNQNQDKAYQSTHKGAILCRICHISIFIHESNQPLSHALLQSQKQKVENDYRYVCIFKILQFGINSSLVIKKLTYNFMNEKKDKGENVLNFQLHTQWRQTHYLPGKNVNLVKFQIVNKKFQNLILFKAFDPIVGTRMSIIASWVAYFNVRF